MWTYQQAGRLTYLPVYRRTNRPTYQQTDQLTDRTTNRPNNRSTYRFDRFFDQSGLFRRRCRPADRPNLPTYLPTDRRLTEPTNRPINQSDRRFSTDRPTDQEIRVFPKALSFYRQTDQPTSQSTLIPTDLPTDRPKHQQTDQPTNSPNNQTTDETDRPINPINFYRPTNQSRFFRRRRRRRSTQGTRRSLATNAGLARLQVPHRTLETRVRIALSARKHTASLRAGLIAPVALHPVCCGVTRSKPVVPGAVEAVGVAPGSRHAKLEPLQEGDNA